MATQQDKATAFRALHHRDHAFVIPNPWDPGTARLLAQLGFEALATTSGGYAFSTGVPDGAVGRDAMLRHVESIVTATALPVSADLENGYGDSPKHCAETIRLAAATGLVGGSIEDVRPDRTMYSIELATERLRAAAEAAHSGSVPFTLTARAENFISGRPDLEDTIRRLQGFQEAGADVLYAPGLTTEEQIRAVVTSVDRPVNVLVGSAGLRFSADELSAMGVRRVSVGSALCRAALTTFYRAAEEMIQKGTFDFGKNSIPYSTWNALFTAREAAAVN